MEQQQAETEVYEPPAMVAAGVFAEVTLGPDHVGIMASYLAYPN